MHVFASLFSTCFRTRFGEFSQANFRATISERLLLPRYALAFLYLAACRPLAEHCEGAGLFHAYSKGSLVHNP